MNDFWLGMLSLPAAALLVAVTGWLLVKLPLGRRRWVHSKNP